MAVGLGVIPQFPASVAVGAGLTLNQANGVFTFGTDIGNASYSGIASPYVRKSSERANDVVRLIEYIPIGVGFDLKDAFPGAIAALNAKGLGGNLDCTGFRKTTFDPIDLGSGSLVITAPNIKLVGDGATVIQSTAATGPVVAIGDGIVQVAGSGIEGIRVRALNTVARTDPIVWLRNGNELKLSYVQAEGLGTATGGIGFMVDGGSFSYNNRLIGVRAQNGAVPLINALVVGKNARVPGFYLFGGFSFGFASGSNIIIYDVDGCNIANGESIGAGLRALEMAPATGQHINCVQMDRIELDTSSEIGWLIKDSGGFVENVTATNIWNCSNGQVSLAGAFHENLRIQGSVAPASWGSTGARITNIKIGNSLMGNAGGGGITTLNCDDIELNAVGVNGNGVSTTAFGYVIGNGSRNIAIRGGSAKGRFGPDAPLTPVQNYAASVDTDTAYISVTGYANWSGNVNNGFAANTSANGGTNQLVLNTGYHT
jgi:hypothetical protein